MFSTSMRRWSFCKEKMASAVVRTNCQSVLRRILSSRNSYSYRLISTSDKNKGDAAPAVPASTAIPDFSKPSANPNWVSYGFDLKDENEDRYQAHSLMFVAVTLIVVTGGFYLTYLPDYQQRDWVQREAFLEIRRREKLGLPLVDKDYIDAKTIILPTDAELGDTDIVI